MLGVVVASISLGLSIVAAVCSIKTYIKVNVIAKETLASTYYPKIVEELEKAEKANMGADAE